MIENLLKSDFIILIVTGTYLSYEDLKQQVRMDVTEVLRTGHKKSRMCYIK